jgi:hypothetical protein
MKIETFHDLIEWTRKMHEYLGQHLQQCASEQTETRAKMLLTYLSDHEKALVKTISAFEERADPKALNTWVYDYLSNFPVTLSEDDKIHYEKLGFDDICEEIFKIHNQIIGLYRHMAERAEIPEARLLLTELLALENHEVMRLAQQTNRLMDL